MALVLKASARPASARKAIATAPLVDGTTVTMPLTSPLVQNGAGSLTFSRASDATFTDWEGLIKTAISGEIRVEGARRVENLSVSSEDLTVTWTTAQCTASKTSFTVDNVSDPRVRLINDTSVVLTNRVFRLSADIWVDSLLEGEIFKVIILDGDSSNGGNSGPITPTTSRKRYTHIQNMGGSSRTDVMARFDLDFSAIGRILHIENIQLEEVTGQSNQNPSEYVSVGVLSDPWHGYGADAVKSFLHENGNSVSSNIVTAGRGADITGAYTLLEKAADNIALYSRDYTQADWVTTNITPVKDATGVDGVPNSASTLTADAGNGTCFQTVTIGSAERTTSFYVKRKTGTGAVEITDNNGTNYTAITINSSTFTRVDITRTQANPVFGFRIVTSGDEIEVDHSQLEAGAAPTSPIETGAGTGSRSADAESMQTSGNFTDSEGSCYGELTPKWNSADISADQYIVGIDSAGSAKLLYIDATNGKIETTDGTNTVADTTVLVKDTTYKFGLSWYGTTISLTVDGTTTTGTFTGTWSPDAIYVGNNDGASEIDGGIANLEFYPRFHTDAQREARTS